MPISDKAKQITNRIYQAYGTHSGIIFGIEPEHRQAVTGIVQAVLDVELGDIPLLDEEE